MVRIPPSASYPPTNSFSSAIILPSLTLIPCNRHLRDPLTHPVEAAQLCTIKSDPSDLRLDDFEKVGYFYNLVGVKFLVAKYKVQVNIEVADILFEVWCNDIKLSKDQRIQVHWKEGAEVGRPLGDEERTEGRARDIWDG